MIFNEFCMTKTLVRLAAVVAIGLAVSACSSVPNWVDPTTWVGSSETADSASPDAVAADNAQYPDLANMPDKPAAPSTSEERQQVAGSLAADRSHVEYSADALRGGTEAAAPPPPDHPAQVASLETQPSSSAPETSSDDTSSSDTSSSDEDSGASSEAAPASQTAAPTAAVTTTNTLPPPATSDTNSSGRLPAVPPDAHGTYTGKVAGSASTPMPVATAMAGPSSLGFQPSHAQPLDPSVSQFVPPSIIAHYQQTASLAGTAGVAANSVTRPAGLKPPAGTDRAVLGTGTSDVGGPESMGGAVVANMDAVSPAVRQASVYSSANGLPPQAVVFFPNDTTILNSEGRDKVKQAADAFMARGGQGYVRVVGHSSSRTANMSVQRHIALNFERSQARANSVARELIKDGVPANKVLVEAVGDSQPVYYESMPKGEEGNRRAEIFFQS